MDSNAKAARDLRRLAAFRLGVSEAHVLAFPERLLEAEQLTRLQVDVDDLRKGRPAAYIFGEVPFLDWDFTVDERALIPRPETEALADWVRRRIAARPPQKILDLCCGSGVLGLALGKSFPEAQVTLTDLSEPALGLCQENAARLEMTTRTRILAGDLFGAISAPETFDLIVANPPYVAEDDRVEQGVLGHEPHLALYSEDSGMAHIKAILDGLDAHMAAGGLAAFELGHNHQDLLDPWLKDRFPGKNTGWVADPFGVLRFLFYDSGTV